MRGFVAAMAVVILLSIATALIGFEGSLLFGAGIFVGRISCFTQDLVEGRR